MAFLTGAGEFLVGRPYTPPDEMVAMLEQICRGEDVSATPARAESSDAAANAAGETLWNECCSSWASSTTSGSAASVLSPSSPRGSPCAC